MSTSSPCSLKKFRGRTASKMWGFTSRLFPWTRSVNPNQASSESSDEEPSVTEAREQGLECPICWESFNMVENVPYVLWCGHILCKNCILALVVAAVKFPTLLIHLPFFISCPWCNLLSLRVVYKGNVRFPCKNYFLLWMVEGINGDRSNCQLSLQHNPPLLTPAGNSSTLSKRNKPSYRRTLEPSASGHEQHNVVSARLQRSLRKSFVSVMQFVVKFPLLIILALIALYVIPVSAVVLALYLCITAVFAVPLFLVLYFAFPSLDRLVRGIFT